MIEEKEIIKNFENQRRSLGVYKEAERTLERIEGKLSACLMNFNDDEKV